MRLEEAHCLSLSTSSQAQGWITARALGFCEATRQGVASSFRAHSVSVVSRLEKDLHLLHNCLRVRCVLETQQGTPGAAWPQPSYCLIPVAVSAAEEERTLPLAGGSLPQAFICLPSSDRVWVWLLAGHRQVSATQTPCDLAWRCYRRCGPSVLVFVQERFHTPSPADCENTFIKAGDSEAKGG